MYFGRLEEAVCAISVLKLPDFTKPCVVDSDALDKELGAVLLQI